MHVRPSLFSQLRIQSQSVGSLNHKPPRFRSRNAAALFLGCLISWPYVYRIDSMKA